MKEIYFSIIMPTYNSQGTIETSLKSIRMQDFPQDCIEILVVDGGSNDKTVEIAQKYGAIVLKNPHKLPEYAKMIGTNHARGRYVIRMDSDEEFIHRNQLSKRKAFLESNPEVKALLANRLVPAKGYGIASKYLNLYGDPFSYFIYRTKEDKITSFSKNITKKNKGYVFEFHKDDIIPIGDAGTTTFALDYLKDNFADKMDDISFACTTFDWVVNKSGICGVIKGDDVVHHSGAGFGTYLSKLRFRVINNLFHKEESGFSARESESAVLKKRKRFFALYVISMIFPVLDSIKLGIKHKDISFCLHFVYLYYVCFYAVYCVIAKKRGKEIINKGYGK